MPVIFSPLTSEQYTQFMESGPRHFISQLPDMGKTYTSLHRKHNYVGLIDTTTNTVVGAALMYYQPWKKFFERAHILYGPTLTWERKDYVTAFFSGLQRYLRKKPRVLSLHISPILPRAFYEDTTKVADNSVATKVTNFLTQGGYSFVDQNKHPAPDNPPLFIYTKDIEGMSFDEALPTLAKGLRRRFRKEDGYGVQVRWLTSKDFDVFRDLYTSTANRAEDMHAMSENSQKTYKTLMDHMGPDKALLCVAFFSAARYIKQIQEEREALRERLAILNERKETKARNREINEITQRFEQLDKDEKCARDTAETLGDSDIPLNSALGFVCGKELVLLLGGMNKDLVEFARDYPVERALFKWACDHGMSIYNTFGVSSIDDDNASDAHVLAFKRLMRGNIEQFIGMYEKSLWPWSRALGAVVN